MGKSPQQTDWLDVIVRCLQAVRKQRPLVHHVTNEVTAEASANAVLALGGLAVMARDPTEVEAVLDQASSLVVNLGTLTRERQAGAERANQLAARIGRPIVIDPVGAGAIPGRDRVARRLLRPSSWSVLRLNASELAGLVGGELPPGRGVDAGPLPGLPGEAARDSFESTTSDTPSTTRARHAPAESSLKGDDPLERAQVSKALAPVLESAVRCAFKHEVHVAVTGPVDLVTDGWRAVYIRTGHPWLARVTGAGCVASSIVGAVLGAAHDRTRLDSILEAAVAGLALYGAAAAWAAEACTKLASTHPHLPPGVGTFRTLLFDALHHLRPEHVTPARVEVWEEKL